MLCVISGGNWNNGSNAGVWALNLNNVRGNSNNNIGFRADSLPKPCAAQADRQRGINRRGLRRNQSSGTPLVVGRTRVGAQTKTGCPAPTWQNMKRTGGLWTQITTTQSLVHAYQRASEGKRSHRAAFEFGRNLGGNIARLQDELDSGAYHPRPLNKFWVKDGRKPRLIEAPAFRDLVVQHSIYAAVGPVLERKYIATCFACRTGLGTHAAADWLQAAMRRAPPTAWVLHVDVRKFFYSIDRATLAALLAKHIKCTRTLDVMALFAHRDTPAGVPIGNLLSQTFANVYLNSLDHHCKRVLKVPDYARYMDDSIMLAPDRATGLAWLDGIRSHLAALDLEISHYSLHPIKRGADFVGYRTWRSGRFVRPSLISAIRSDARKGRLPSLISRIAMTLRTKSFHHVINHIHETHHALFDRLPQSHRRHHHPYPALAAA
jgi:retron-type reverse transcriptase